MPAILATGKDLKRVSVTIHPNGQVTQGSIHENMARNVMGGARPANTVATQGGREETPPSGDKTA